MPSNFNPRTPVGCDDRARRPAARRSISIHAPQWGATALHVKRRLDLGNFNPRTPVGCDFQVIHAAECFTYFNPRTPVGCDSGSMRSLLIVCEISIHAPQWGATLPPNCLPPAPLFQSTHPSGVRPKALRSASARSRFQSTHPSGVRPAARQDDVHGRAISIHAPQWGATNIRQHRHPAGNDFNPRTPVGCDPRCPSRGQAPNRNFNPRTPVGCDRAILRQPILTCRFQSTHPSGVRHVQYHRIQLG